MTVTPAEIGEQQIAALILKRMQKAEKTVAKAFRGFLSEQVRSILDDLHESQAAVVQFNPPSWDEKLIETMRPVDAAESNGRQPDDLDGQGEWPNHGRAKLATNCPGNGLRESPYPLHSSGTK